MNFRAIVVVVFLVVVSGGLMVHFRQQSITGVPSGPVKTDDVPVPPKTGPYGKFVVADEPVHHFGVMELGQKGSHEFKIRNDGPGPLKMVALARDHTCQCTLGTLGADGLKPGEESTVTMKWEIKNPATTFEHSAKIRTDDPDNPVITFLVRGLVGKRLTIRTGSEVLVGQLSDTKVTERILVVHSETVDAFEITKLESSNPAIVVTSRPLVGAELREATLDPAVEASSRVMRDTRQSEAEGKKPSEAGHEGHNHAAPGPDGNLATGMQPEVKSGYELKVVFNSGLPIGKFRESLTIHTDIDIPETSSMVIMFEGSRAGPIEILGTPGTGWSPTEALLRFPRFRAKEGKKAKLLVFVKKTETPWEITDANVSPSFLKYQLIKDENFKGLGRDRYDLFIEIPAGERPVSLGGETIGSLILSTNHPDAKSIRLGIEFTSY